MDQSNRYFYLFFLFSRTDFKGITPHGIKCLSEGVAKLENLDTLALKFGWYFIISLDLLNFIRSDTIFDEGVISMTQNLIKLQQLKSLQLGFY